MKNRSFLKLFGLAAIAVFCVAATTVPQGKEKSFIDNDDYTCIDAADLLMKEYYGDVCQENEGKEICTFDSFCDLYRKTKMDIKTYTDKVTNDPMLEDNDYVMTLNIKKSSSSSGDENYIIGKDQDYFEGAPNSAFRRQPIYRGYYDYTVEECDIVYESFTIFGSTGHAACIVDPWIHTDAPYSQQFYYTQTIEAVGSGVNFGFLDDERVCRFGILIYRYNNNGTKLTGNQRFAIHQFLIDQVGKPYNLSSGYSASINKAEWMCSTLVEAAYEYSGAKLFNTGSYMYPDKLVTSNKLVEIKPYNPYLKINVIKHNMFLWISQSYQITITNRSSSYVTVDYYSTACSRPNASQFQGSGTLKTLGLSGNATSGNVTITDTTSYHTMCARYTVNNFRNSGRSVSFVTVYDFSNKLERYVYIEN